MIKPHHCLLAGDFVRDRRRNPAELLLDVRSNFERSWSATQAVRRTAPSPLSGRVSLAGCSRLRGFLRADRSGLEWRSILASGTGPSSEHICDWSRPSREAGHAARRLRVLQPHRAGAEGQGLGRGGIRQGRHQGRMGAKPRQQQGPGVPQRIDDRSRARRPAPRRFWRAATTVRHIGRTQRITVVP